jgi:lipopolysaccharide/colanic/teichoic acid biosynthesis glycosyltransferase
MATLRTERPGTSRGPQPPAQERHGRTTKYVLDRMIGALALLFTAPILLLLALALLAARTRPLLNVDYRLGENGRMVSLRSFAITAEQLRKRRWRLVVASGAAALPQLWSVVRGELSLVGPRPRELGLEPPPVRPGLTGLAQLSQLDGWLALADQLQLDDEYARTWSLGLDARIVWRTIVRTLR